MKKTVIALGILTSVVIACTPKVSKTPAPEPPPSTSDIATDAESIKAGSVLIGSDKCTKCHKDKTDYVPGHTFEEQEKLMLAMAKKAKFTPEETAGLMAYVKANAKK
ncbi:MAG: hypothetical protein QM594_04280 [Niabella sp.]